MATSAVIRPAPASPNPVGAVNPSRVTVYLLSPRSRVPDLGPVKELVRSAPVFQIDPSSIPLKVSTPDAPEAWSVSFRPKVYAPLSTRSGDVAGATDHCWTAVAVIRPSAGPPAWGVFGKVNPAAEP